MTTLLRGRVEQLHGVLAEVAAVGAVPFVVLLDPVLKLGPIAGDS
jgi:hypothetical protein